MTDLHKKLGTCEQACDVLDRWIHHRRPHIKSASCKNWREQPAQGGEPLTQAMKTAIAYGKRAHPEGMSKPAQGEPPPLTNPVVRKAYESGVDTGFKVGQMNPDQIKWWFDEREAAVIDEIATKQELSRQAVLRQALRVYQLIVVGSHELRELNPMPKSAGPVEGMSAERCICGSFRETNGYCKVCNKIYPAGAVDRAELRAAQIGTAIIKEYPFPGPDDRSVVDSFCDLRDALKDARIKLDRVAAELLMHINDEDFTMSLTNLYVYLTEDE